MTSSSTETEARMEEMRAEIERLREALAPFTRGGWGKDFYENAPEETPVIVQALPKEMLGRSFYLTKADFDRARDVYNADRFFDDALKLSLRDKGYATGRLDRAITYCANSGDFDQEEIDHLREILRIVMEGVPAYYFFGFGDF